MQNKLSLTQKRLTKGCVLLTSLFAAVAIHAQTPATQPSVTETQPPQVEPRGPENRLPPPCLAQSRGPLNIIETLGLTQDQQTQLAALAQTTHEQVSTLRGQIREVHQQLNAELVQANPNKEAITQLQTQYAGLSNQLTTQMMEARVQSFELLTPEQRTVLAQERSDRQARIADRQPFEPRRGMHHHHGHRGNHGENPSGVPGPSEQAPSQNFGWLLMNRF